MYTGANDTVWRELVQALYTRPTSWADEILLKQVILNTVFAVCRATTGRLDGLRKELAVEWTGETCYSRGWPVAYLGFGQNLGSSCALSP